MNNSTTMRFRLELGVLVRRAYLSAIKDAAFHFNIKMEIDEDKGLLDSTYRIVAKGAKDDLSRLESYINRLVKSEG